MLLTALVTAALFCLLQGRAHRRRLALVAARRGWRWALAVLCKGPVGIAVPLLAWFAGRGALPPPPRRASACSRRSSPSPCASPSSYPGSRSSRATSPAFLRYALRRRDLPARHLAARFHRGGAPYYYAVVLAWAGGAWSVLLLALAPALYRRWRAGGTDARRIAFAARAAVALVIFFSSSASKRPQYILPALVPLALLIAIGVAAEPRARHVGAARARRRRPSVAGIGAAIGGHLGFAPAHGDLRVVTPAVVLAAGLVLVAWGLLASARGRRPLTASLVHGDPRAGSRAGAARTAGVYAESRSSRALAQQVPDDARLVAAVSFRTSLPFYLRRPVLLVSGNGHELTSHYVVAMRDRFMGGHYLQSVDRFADAIDGETPTLILVTRWRKQDIRRMTKRRLELVDADRRSMLLRPAG